MSKIKNLTKVCFILICSHFLFGCKAYYKAFYTDETKCFVNASNNKPYDVVIIPGYPSEPGKIDPLLIQRIHWAYYLYKNDYAKNIIVSGSAVYTAYVEAEVMRLCALTLGIPSKHIFVEPKAEHTTENLYYSCLIAEKQGFKKIAFASQTQQTSFMKQFARKFKLKMDMIPIVADSIYSMSSRFDTVNISSAFVPNFISIEKREGFFKRLRGTRGHKVKVEMRKARKLKRKQKRNS